MQASIITTVLLADCHAGEDQLPTLRLTLTSVLSVYWTLRPLSDLLHAASMLAGSMPLGALNALILLPSSAAAHTRALRLSEHTWQ